MRLRFGLGVHRMEKNLRRKLVAVTAILLIVRGMRQGQLIRPPAASA